MRGSRIKLIDFGLHDTAHKIIITTVAGHCYLSRRRYGGSPS
jgi:hypothetical protein